MTNNNPVNNQTPAKPPKKGFSWWINSLLGRPQVTGTPVSPSQPAPNKSAPTSESKAPVDSSVSQDLESLKKLVGGFSKKIAPKLEKGVSESTQVAGQMVKKVDKKFVKILSRIFFVLLFGIVLYFLATKLFNSFNQSGGGRVEETPTPIQGSPSPTPFTNGSSNPSVYSEDPVILKFQEDIDVLIREMSGTNIKETQLNPPTLDFNVSF